MKISNSKKQLAKIIHENGGWREGAEFTAQDGDGTGSIDFFKSKPRLYRDNIFWRGDYDCDNRIERTGVTIKNWHQTILSRAEYFHLYPAAETAPEPEIQSEIMGIPQVGDINVVESKPTIEQLAAEYRNLKDFADRKQQEAGAAKVDAEAKLAELVAAGKALGLALSVTDAESKPERAIIDWRDLQVDDLIWYAGDDELSYGEYRVMGVENPDYEGYRTVLVNGYRGGHWIDTRAGWGFIRRP